MTAPQEVCEKHDLRIDEYGCWACGHAGPITEDLWPSWCRFANDIDLGGW